MHFKDNQSLSMDYWNVWIIKEPKSNRLIHAKCGPKCNYCLKPLYLEEFLDNEENKVHMKCFVNYRRVIENFLDHIFRKLYS